MHMPTINQPEKKKAMSAAERINRSAAAYSVGRKARSNYSNFYLNRAIYKTLVRTHGVRRKRTIDVLSCMFIVFQDYANRKGDTTTPMLSCQQPEIRVPVLSFIKTISHHCCCISMNAMLQFIQGEQIAFIKFRNFIRVVHNNEAEGDLHV